MLSGPTGGFTATMRVPGAAARSAARRIFSVIETVVFGLTTRMSIRCLDPPAPQRSDQYQRYQDHGERHAGRHRAEGVDLGIGHGRREAGQLERQRVLVGAQRWLERAASSHESVKPKRAMPTSA